MATELELLKKLTLQEESVDDEDLDDDDGIDEGSDDDDDEDEDEEEEEMEGMLYENIHQDSGDSEESYE